MNASPVLYPCPPLSARITKEQCARNAEIGRKGRGYRPGTQARLDASPYDEKCHGCPGVEALAKKNGFEVERYTTRPQEESPLKRRQRKKIAPGKKNAKTKKKWRAQEGQPLSPTQERVLPFRRAHPEMTWDEIAEALGMTKGNASVHYSQALKKLGRSPGRNAPSVGRAKRRAQKPTEAMIEAAIRERLSSRINLLADQLEQEKETRDENIKEIERQIEALRVVASELGLELDEGRK